MSHRSRLLAATFTLLLVSVSCAGPGKLADRSAQSLRSGDADAAYRWARNALEKDPHNPKARAAMTAAAPRYVERWKERVRNLADVDSVAAAHLDLGLDPVRLEIARLGIAIPPDPAFRAEEKRLREGAAGILYREAVRRLAEQRPKLAWAKFDECRTIVADYRDVERRLVRARELARVRVALLPVWDETGVRGLGEEVDEWLARELAARVAQEGFRFTEWIDPSAAGRAGSGAHREWSAERAGATARRLGAQAVFRCRVSGLRADTDRDRVSQAVYRRVSGKDSLGRVHDRYEERVFEATLRERRVSLAWEMELLDARTGQRLGAGEERPGISALTVSTSFEVAGECADYCLVPPALAGSERARRVEAQWKERFGSWTLPQLLDFAAADPSRVRRSRPPSARARRPMFVDELPPPGELALAALERVWEPMLESLREIERRDGPAGTEPVSAGDR